MWQRNRKWPWTNRHTRKLRKAVENVLARCTNEEHPHYHSYGGRGIEVRFDSPIEFVEHLLTLEGCDDPSLVLDRIDNDGHYEPGNLRFATYSQSSANTRRRDVFSEKGIVRYHRQYGSAKAMTELRAKGCTYGEIGRLYCLDAKTVWNILSPNYQKDSYVIE